MTQLTVLILDREPVIAAHIAAMLADLGHASVHVVTECEAVEAAVRHRPNLMIVDPWLSTGSEIAGVNEILRGGYIPHIYLSGAMLDPAIIDHRAVVIDKPFWEGTLVQAIQRLLTVTANGVLSTHTNPGARHRKHRRIGNRTPPVPETLGVQATMNGFTAART